LAKLERAERELSPVLTDAERERRLLALVEAGVLHVEGDKFTSDWQSDGSDLGDALCELFNS